MKRIHLIWAISILAMLCGCDRTDVTIREQSVPKQAPPMLVSAGSSAGMSWTVPAGWKELPPQQMRLASFAVSADHPDVQMTIVPLPGESGGLVANINRWENQLALPPTAAADVPKLIKQIQVEGLPVDLVDLVGPSTATPPLRTLGAILPFGGTTYYFKLSGQQDVVASQQENFVAFVRSIHFGAPPQEKMSATPPPVAPPAPLDASKLPPGHPPMPSAALSGEAGSDNLGYAAPSGWTKDEPLPLRIVSFHIGEGESRADVIVSRLPATGTGSYLDNINRWRAQVGLTPSEENDRQPVVPLIVGGIDSMQFDYVGPGNPEGAKRMLLAWVPRGEDWWFFKLVGPSATVAQQKANFDAFMKSVQFESAKP